MKYLYVLIRTMLGGLSNNITKISMHAIPMNHFLVIRTFLMLLISLGSSKNIKSDLHKFRTNKKVRNSLVLSVVLYSIASVFFYTGLSLLPVSIVSAIDNSLHLIAVTFIGVLFFGQKHGKTFYILLALLLPSTALLVVTDLSKGLEVSAIGILCLVSSATLHGLESHITKDQLKFVSVKGVVSFKTFGSMITFIVLSIINKDSIELTIEGMSLLVGALIIYGAVNSVIIKLLHTKSIKEIGATVTTLFTTLTPVFSIIFALFIFGETLQWSQWLGVGCTIFILYFITRVK